MSHGPPAWKAQRALRRLLVAILPVLFVLASSSRAEAYTWMIRHAYTGCGVCHADPPGGETLTPYRRPKSDLLLRMRYDEKSAEDAAPGKASGFLGFIELPPNVMLGGSARMASTLKGSQYRLFPMQ